MKYFLYILKSETGDKYYTGISQNPVKRLEYHNTFEKGFTARYRPWKIVYTREYNSKEEAMIVGKKIKRWKRMAMIEKIINYEIDI
jgi:putative endonuclease